MHFVNVNSTVYSIVQTDSMLSCEILKGKLFVIEYGNCIVLWKMVFFVIETFVLYR